MKSFFLFKFTDTSHDHLSLVPLMQIDCEVLNTRLIHVKNGAIPQHLRNSNQTESTYRKRTENIKESPQNFTDQQYTPYFMKNAGDKAYEKEMFLDDGKQGFQNDTEWT